MDFHIYNMKISLFQPTLSVIAYLVTVLPRGIVLVL